MIYKAKLEDSVCKFRRTHMLMMKVQGCAKPKSILRQARIRLLKRLWEKVEDSLMLASDKILDPQTTQIVFRIVAIP